MRAAEVTPDSSLRKAHRAALASLAALAAVLVLWHLARYSAGTAALSLGVTLLPLALPLYGLLRRSRRACVLSTLVIAPYLAYAIMEALANPGARSYAIATLGAASLLFLSLVAWLRCAGPTARPR